MNEFSLIVPIRSAITFSLHACVAKHCTLKCLESPHQIMLNIFMSWPSRHSWSGWTKHSGCLLRFQNELEKQAQCMLLPCFVNVILNDYHTDFGSLEPSVILSNSFLPSLSVIQVKMHKNLLRIISAACFPLDLMCPKNGVIFPKKMLHGGGKIKSLCKMVFAGFAWFEGTNLPVISFNFLNSWQLALAARTACILSVCLLEPWMSFMVFEISQGWDYLHLAWFRNNLLYVFIEDLMQLFFLPKQLFPEHQRLTGSLQSAIQSLCC